MEKVVCHVCLSESNENDNRVFLKSICRGEEVYVCTACIPQVIHGSGDVVKTKAEVEEIVKNR